MSPPGADDAGVPRLAWAALLGIHGAQTAAARLLGFAVPLVFVSLEGAAGSSSALATFNATVQAVKLFALLALGGLADAAPLWAVGATASLGQVAGAACCLLFLAAGPSAAEGEAPDISARTLVAMVLLGSVAELSKEFASVGLEMRVAPAMFSKDASESQLAGLNSVVKRVELSAKLVVPVAFGVFASAVAGSVRLLVTTVSLALLVGACAVALLWFRLPLAALVARDDAARHAGVEGQAVQQTSATLRQVVAVVGPIAGMSLAYSMLFCSVLSDHDPMATAYLASRGVSSAALGVSRSAGALAGLLGTWIWPRLQRRFGTVRGAEVALWCFVVALAPAAPSLRYAAVPMMAFVTLSRPFLWTFDVAMISVLQEKVPGRWRGKAASAQAVACQLFESAISAVAVACSGSGGFHVLAMTSFLMIAAAGALFSACAAAHGAQGRDNHVAEYHHA